MLLLVIWLLPLLGAVLAWAFGPQLRGWTGPKCTALVGLSFLATAASWGAATGAGGAHVTLVSWLPGWTFGLQLDKLSLVWTLIITGVGFLIHLYSIGYMSGDRAFARFFAYMNFFVFAMLTLVLSDNVVGLLVGWGLVGLASYFLIGFWFERPTAVAAARKAFVMNVVGDVGIMFAIFVIIARIGAIGFADVFTKFPTAFSGPDLFLVCLGLFIGCAAKSAQVPLHTWLPDAMEGPTPVSALIHAATMVTAGVYLVARFAPLWNASPDARALVGVIGALTAILGAILGCVQWDIKRILAYSTMSQIGYMIMGVGVGAFEGGVLHFLTHAFFKAQLFLTSGIVIHALHDEQDVRRMGGLRTRLPFAFWAMLVGVLAICGVPGLSGFFSKDLVLYTTLQKGHPWLYAIGVLTAGITAYYMFRLLFVTFLGSYRGEVDPSDLGIRHPELAGTAPAVGHAEEHEPAGHGHAPAWLMSLPVAILIPFSILIGWLGLGGESSPWARFFGDFFGTTNGPVTSAPFGETVSTLLVLLVVIAGFAVAAQRYWRGEALANAVPRLRNEAIHAPALLVNAYYFDAAYDWLLVRPARALGSWFVRFVDPRVIDAGVREAAISAQWLGHLFRSFETGLVRVYALTIALGVVCFVAYYTLSGVAR
ncbi:MAG TPA: NADH-quinone oxidoreductase subunit L [Candidatus Sulfotelmatobacter sp.]|nr:NADH-quinone oxidoreductase subunit L [Candidatus Sulfotelmatobacter sp.]